jgi:hypothetical protein
VNTRFQENPMVTNDSFAARQGLIGLSSAAAGPSNANVLVHLAGPVVGSEVGDVVRELASVAGVARVRPGAKLPKLLLIDYDPAVIGAQSLIARVQRRFAAARLVGM